MLVVVQMVFKWFGTTRANLNRVNGTITSLDNFNAKRPTDPLFTPAETATLNAAQAIMQAKLALKVPR